MANEGRDKSPQYPAFDLESAISRTAQLQRLSTATRFHINTAFGLWEYKSKTGTGAVLVAALRYYGLIEVEGSGEGRTLILTDRAIKIFSTTTDQKTRETLIREAALKPEIFRRIYERFADAVASELDLISFLKNLGFSATGVNEVLKNYQRTMEFAGLDDPRRITTREQASMQSGNRRLPLDQALSMPASSYPPVSGLFPYGDMLAESAAFPIMGSPIGKGMRLIRFPYRYRGTVLELSMALPTPLTKKEWETIKRNMETQLEQLLDEEE